MLLHSLFLQFVFPSYRSGVQKLDLTAFTANDGGTHIRGHKPRDEGATAKWSSVLRNRVQ